MAKRGMGTGGSGLFEKIAPRRHLRLFLAKYVQKDAQNFPFDEAELKRAQDILLRWADRAEEGNLRQKETSLDGDFLAQIFGDALGYKSGVESPNDYHREKNPAVQGVGLADGALGLFAAGKTVAPTVIMELKGADTDLDHDKVNGRTAVQQCWDYLNQLPDTPWGIVSNYITIRLYHHGSPARAYEEFTIDDFRDPERFRQFYYIFERHGLVGNRSGIPRVNKLLNATRTQKLEVSDKLYAYYSAQRQELVGVLMKKRKLTQDQAIHVAQRLLDRIIFMAFCQDRGLLPEKLIRNTWEKVAPLARATNPRWQNFLDAFHAIDKGHIELDLPAGYNGGLFKHDDLVDELNIEDAWIEVFKNIGEYDFRDEGEISVDVLGHIFEQSITELEKYRAVGLFGEAAAKILAQMPKSAERKRFGIYYTPPEFTRLIVEKTLGKVIAERVDGLSDPKQRVAALRRITVVDPACGSGAFLIAAYERLEEAYEEAARMLRIDGHIQEAVNLTSLYPDYILVENIYGVDLSAESVEITQLALWIRSARKGRALSDLSNNIRHGNSLIHDPAVHPMAFDWRQAFPKVSGRFDVVIGNPPWERMKIQEREFFSLAAPQIASAVNAAERRKLIATIETKNPDLWERYKTAQANADRALAYVRTEAAHFPFTGKGDVNTYMLFAELARQLVDGKGYVGLLVPSGIATDNTTKEFFADLMNRQALAALYDFENKRPWFPDVHRSFKFSVLLVNGQERTIPETEFVFFAHDMEDLQVASRKIPLSLKDLRLLNPNTRTCPVFETRRDAQITKAVYKRVPILVDESRESGGNPWGIKFCRMFDQTNDAEKFIAGEPLQKQGLSLVGNRWIKGKRAYLPLYEAKMIQGYDHRAATVRIEAGNWMRQGQTDDTNLVEHQNPEFVVQPRYWVDGQIVLETLSAERIGFIGFKDITSPTNRRTMIASAIPWSAVTNHFPLLLSDLPWRRQLCLLGNLNSLAFDYVCRQKIGGITLNFFIVEQLPTLPPDAYDEKCPWAKSKKLEDWIAARVLKLTCTANDMLPLAKAAGFDEGVHKWQDAERAELRAELDAAYFHLYGISRDDVEYILGTFQGIAKEDQTLDGLGTTRRAILDAYQRLAP